ncbi:MAG: RloB domain-containing protein [Saprospiraceae bacterium]|nr:RloB domain-containing protein [Saprospiraceae bacterium]
MARKIKIDNAVLKRFESKARKRKVGHIPLRKYFLIICEGAKTEPNYFEALKKRLPPGVMEYIEIEGEGRNTLNLIEEAEKIRNEKESQSILKRFDYTWAVFDRDSFPAENFDNAIHKAQELKRKIDCAWSNEAFELWYLLHLEFINTPLSRKDYGPKIEKWLSQRMGKKFKYTKNRPDMYRLLQQYGNEEQAIKWAGKLDESYTSAKYSTHNPCTKVYLLVEQLNQLT